MPIRLLSLILCISFAVSCGRMQPAPSGLWFYVYPEDQGSMPHKKSLHAVSFLWLGKDGHYSMDLDGFSYGTWEKRPDALLLRSQEGSLRRFGWKGGTLKEISLEDSVLGSLYFEREPAGFRADSLSPFSPANNQWRIRATHAESDSEILSRLRNHCRFYEMYFRWAQENEMKYLDVRSTPSPIRIYGNGIAVKNAQDLPLAWKHYFFNDSDCQRASLLLTNRVRQNDIAWPATDSKFKMFISAFRQLEDFLR